MSADANAPRARNLQTVFGTCNQSSPPIHFSQTNLVVGLLFGNLQNLYLTFIFVLTVSGAHPAQIFDKAGGGILGRFLCQPGRSSGWARIAAAPLIAILLILPALIGSSKRFVVSCIP
ncbi:hypothetical protein [Microcoleus sp. FACHB-1515]|uniref:hypothetical protein n=1 Tax=Cyanophyceae TaxID=3028117 RepID=UPI001F551A16|nr:hypothetical protein [Microcoleus sp. FACHB-1515]